MSKLRLVAEVGVFSRGGLKRVIMKFCLVNNLHYTVTEQKSLFSSLLVFEIEGKDRAALEHLKQWFEGIINTHGI